MIAHAQCDGCSLKLPLENGVHVWPEKSGWARLHMRCGALGKKQPSKRQMQKIAQKEENAVKLAEDAEARQ